MIYYYTYLITNTKQNKFYIGSRQCEIDPVKDLGVKYFSSSHDKDFIEDQKQNSDDYEYIVLGLFSSRDECLKREMELHETYKVSKNKAFYNRANCTSTGFNVSGTVTVKDKDGNTMQVSVVDSRFLSGKLTTIWAGRQHSDEAKSKIGKANSIAQSGYGNSQYGTMWITNPTEKKNLKIKKTDPIPAGWMKGRKMGY